VVNLFQIIVEKGFAGLYDELLDYSSAQRSAGSRIDWIVQGREHYPRSVKSIEVTAGLGQVGSLLARLWSPTPLFSLREARRQLPRVSRPKW
jgi:hypothetical protein